MIGGSTEPIRRRSFLKKNVGLFVLAACGAPVIFPLGGPGERIRVAVVGIRGRGKSLALGFASLPDAEVVAVCDPDTRLLAGTAKEVAERQRIAPRQVKDFRTVLEDKSVDALAIATPDHWHALATLWACQAGKDVYVEKPCSHNVREGRLMVEAARKYGRVVQHGTQSRSGAHFQSAVAILRSGKLGKILVAVVTNHQKRANIGRAAVQAVPAGVDYDLWLGPAPVRPFTQNRFHYNWHWFWDYGTGDIGNDGVHQLDIARWGLGVGAPVGVTASGAKLRFDDDQETPDTQTVVFEYEGCQILYEMRLWAGYRMPGHATDNDNVFYGEKGMLRLDGTGWRVTYEGNQPGEKSDGSERDQAHLRNFLDCMRTRKRPNADIEEAHLSSLLAHLGNISCRVGRKIRFNPEKEAILGDPEAGKYLRREYRAPFRLENNV